MIIPALLIGGGIATVASHAYDSRKQGTHSPLRKSPRRRKRKRLVRELSTTDHHSSTNPLLSTNHILAQQAPAKLATGIGLMTVGGALWWANAHGLTAVVLTNRLIAFSSKSSFGAPLFLAVYTVAPLVFFPSSLLTIASGVLFGSVKGFGLSFVGCMASASIAYGIGHRLRMTAADSEGNLTLELNTAASDGRGKNAIDLSRFSSLTSYVERMKENPFATMVTMHLLFLPFDLVSYSAGLFALAWRPYILGTALGALPSTLFLTLAGASIRGTVIRGVPTLNPAMLVTSGLIFVGSITLARTMNRRQNAIHNSTPSLPSHVRPMILG